MQQHSTCTPSRLAAGLMQMINAVCRVVPEVPLGSSQRELVYRLGSVGQDCQMLLWDMAITEEAVAAMGPPG